MTVPTMKEMMYIIHHVFLPPKLPNETDENPKYESFLLEMILDTLNIFKIHFTGDELNIICSVITMIRRLKDSHTTSGCVSKDSLKDVLTQLVSEGGHVLIHVHAQNAALLMTKCGDSVNIEAFELSPRNEPVITTLGRLRREFPGPSLTMNLNTFSDPDLLDTIANTLERMSHEQVTGTKSKVRKAGKDHDEDRDTTHPMIVTELLMAFLRPMCEAINLRHICKNTREEVMYRDARSPWRRSPVWLMLRVAIQLVMTRQSETAEAGKNPYKSFMLFFMSYILNDLSKRSTPSDYLHVMSSKISRRLLKIDISEEVSWLFFVRGALERTATIINRRWSKTQKESGVTYDLKPLRTLNLSEDTHHSLTELDTFLANMTKETAHTQFPEAFKPLSFLIEFDPSELPDPRCFIDNNYRMYNLIALERWVAEHLGHWIDVYLDSGETCAQLADLIKSYHSAAMVAYDKNPEALSVMLLTLLELWVACDKAAVRTHNLLQDYDPCVPIESFQNLLLPFHSQMGRLVKAESYVQSRMDDATHTGSGIFTDYGKVDCFSVRYFNDSTDHQRLREKIEEAAHHDRELKKAELQEKKGEYKNLMDEHRKAECEYSEELVSSGYRRNAHIEKVHRKQCRRCALLREAASISIHVHEWPLPRRSLQAKSTVFELNPPRAFACWRETTVYFITDILKSEYLSSETPQAHYALATYNALSPYLAQHQDAQRIGLPSQDKPHTVTHRREKAVIEITEDQICLANGLNFRYYDSKTATFLENFKKTQKCAEMCVYKLPTTCAALQKFLFRPAEACDGPPPNDVIASQHACPEHMSHGEYIALCNIPLGVRTQWVNILLQLAMPSVDWKKLETCLFIFQTIYQAGPPNGRSTTRRGHDILVDKDFAKVLLNKVDDATARIKENWEGFYALWSFIALMSRLLSLAPSNDIQQGCLIRLRQLRGIAFEWTELVRAKASEATNDKQRGFFVTRAVHLALICASSFDMEENHLYTVLSDNLEASILIQCSMLIQDWSKPLSQIQEPSLLILHWRWNNLCSRSHRFLSFKILRDKSSVLDIAIGKSWAAFQAGSSWSPVSDESNCWLVSRTTHQNGAFVQSVIHFNLLTGELLVNGLPLSRLPTEYMSYESYGRLFSCSALEVMPSAMKGMRFSIKRDYMGHTVHIGLSKASKGHSADLLVKAMKGGQLFQFIPPRVLLGMFPDAYIKDFVHWYSLEEDVVEFRPIDKPWDSSATYWRLTRDPQRCSWCLVKDGLSLISLKSKTAESIANVLRPIADSTNIHCVFVQALLTLEIEVPMLQLGFVLHQGSSSIQSKQCSGMEIDSDQSLGSLVGLQNRLLFSDIRKGAGRAVIVLDGPVSFNRDGGHVRVHIDRQRASGVQTYIVDTQLGRLVDNGSLQSKLILCYLHAVTSFCIPDPLTGRTGTEQALWILRSAAVRSFEYLKPENFEILALIAKLTPGRTYYPIHERVMQSVDWNKHLSFLAQHGNFYVEVTEIFQGNRRRSFFYSDISVQYPDLPHVENNLLQRDCIRSSIYYISGFGAESHTHTEDRQYTSLDCEQYSPAGLRAFQLSKMIHAGMSVRTELDADRWQFHLWFSLSRTERVLGLDDTMDGMTAVYDAQLVLEPNEAVRRHWCSIHQRILSSGSNRLNNFQAMLWLSTMAFSDNADTALLEILAALYTIPGMHDIVPPPRSSFSLKQGSAFDKSSLRQELNIALLPLEQSPESTLHRLKIEKLKKFKSRQSRIFRENQGAATEKFILALERQWPTRSPQKPAADVLDEAKYYINVEVAMEVAKRQFDIWSDNKEFCDYLSQISIVLARQTVCEVPREPYLYSNTKPPELSKRKFICIGDLLCAPCPEVETVPPEIETLLRASSVDSSSCTRLQTMIERLVSFSESDFTRSYVDALRKSIDSLQEAKEKWMLVSDHPAQLDLILEQHLYACQQYSRSLYDSISSCLKREQHIPCHTASSVHATMVAIISAGHCPRISPVLLLEQLTRQRWGYLSTGWKRCLVAYGCSLTAVQRAQRLVGWASTASGRDDLIKELRNPGHTNWNPMEFPESLVLEVDNGLLIREVQEQIAGAMRANTEGNTVMQLNMGEGKSSVIVPIVATALANGERLVRVLVAKPQSRQMFQMLVSKLGGLLNRRVYHLPVSRAMKIGREQAVEIEAICRECMHNGGVLLLQPEHILSLKLMGLECAITGNEAAGTSVMRTMELFQSQSRDLVDESDENFSVKFELIYTMGAQRPVEFSPRRWTMTHEVLDLVRQVARRIKAELPQSIEVETVHAGGFPRIRLLREDAGEKLLSCLLEIICDCGLDGFPISRQPEEIRKSVFNYLLHPKPATADIDVVENEGPTGFWSDLTKSPLLLLRGLFAGGILVFCLGQKRWRVNYGPDTNRRPPTRLAVPYRAKDNPAPRAEFSHPDVVIVLTTLSYYYAGLSNDDLFLAFDHLLKSDQAHVEYQMWVADAPHLPRSYRQLDGINLEDERHCVQHVFPGLRSSKSVIDYFLSNIVFPKEMKEFPQKLAASGWDLGEIKRHPTTGFSGTNDSRTTLPLDIAQLDLPDQNHTNALVLDYLLGDENSVAFYPPKDTTSGSDAKVLLDMVTGLDPPAQVILDVGAQILELGNREVAAEWLELSPSVVLAVVFFNDNDELYVLDRKGRAEPLQVSPFAKQLGSCHVFLDEAHTRGTDLRLPSHYRAAVTLGPGLTKDKIVQACMRMRKLGKGQSVIFYIPEDIKSNILSLTGKPNESEIGMMDVLCWAVSGTWEDTRRSMPLWAVQGKRFGWQRQLWEEAQSDRQVYMTSLQAARFLEPECQSLEDRYRPRRHSSVLATFTSDGTGYAERIHERCRGFQQLDLGSTQLQEEQERELAPEIEQERQVEHLRPMEPAAHKLHRDVLSFATTGVLIQNSKAYKPAFEVLRNTSAASHLNVSEFRSSLLATEDFAITVQISDTTSFQSDSYQRPVQWLLATIRRDDPRTSMSYKDMMLISPFEAEQLLPQIRQSGKTQLLIYAPRRNRGFSSLDKLDLYSVPVSLHTPEVPPSLRIQLNLFSGQLYIGSYKEYLEICEFLGVSPVRCPEGWLVAADGFILKGESRSAFSRSPLAFLKILMSQIRKGSGKINKTHVGKILDGNQLCEVDFE